MKWSITNSFVFQFERKTSSNYLKKERKMNWGSDVAHWLGLWDSRSVVCISGAIVFQIEIFLVVSFILVQLGSHSIGFGIFLYNTYSSKGHK